MIRYRDDQAPDGHTGVEKDGTVEIRRGVKDLDLGESHYAQVRILVDNDQYIKGMAFYSDNMPDGVDVVFNTNKTSDQAGKVLKPIKPDDPNNPFGSLLREEGGQYKYTDSDGERKLGLINKTRHEGDWGDWADALPSQFLCKQSMTLIHKQLDLAKQDKQLEYDDICSLTNPTVKKALLESFANDCDAAAIHLKAAALPRQKYQVILPISTMKDTEVYAPRYEDGETVALIRYPHGSTAEIPILRVNNKQPDGRVIIGNTAADAIGINSKVAERLSGADFDGDTVMVIPCNSGNSKIKITSRLKNGTDLPEKLKGLEGFDPKMEYPERQGMKYMKYDTLDETGHKKTVDYTQREMGTISNLITDMTLRGAVDEESVRAIKHSMVVIDAGKHKLDYKRSEEENGIAALKKKYQRYTDEDGDDHSGGASTLISRAKSPVSVIKRRGQPKINEKGKEWYDPNKPDGALIYKEVYEEYVDKKGKTRVRTQESTRMGEIDDARRLSSGTLQEDAYAEYANTMKA
ncbi:MAG: helix-turn-helix domain-containing protein, partial [Clostridia bacterium]